jgi:hypothetical protein
LNKIKKTVAQWARTNMLHFAHHWPAKANVRFWTMAIDYALWVFNPLSNLVNGLLPNKIWSTCHAPTEEFNWSHVFGCPVYVLDAALQDGHKIPKWAPRACLGIFTWVLYFAFIPSAHHDECQYKENISSVSCYLE